MATTPYDMEEEVARARITAALVLAAAASLALSACEARTDQGGSAGNEPQADAPAEPANAHKPEGDGNAKCSNVAIAYAGTINGENAALGQNILNGVKLAVKKHNDANKDCQVELKEFETEGVPEKAPGIVTQMVNTKEIVGVVGLPFSGESKAAGNIFDKAGLPQISPSATNPALAENGWKTFFRGLGNDNAQGPAAAKFLTENLGAEKVCVVQDDSEYGIGLAEAVKEALGDKVVCNEKVKTKQKEFSAVVQSIKAAQPDAVYYSGYYQEGAPFAQQLFDAGVEAQLVGPDGVKDVEYVKGAGDAAAETFFTCPCVPGEGFTKFAGEYRDMFDKDPGTYSVEGYDAATVLLSGIDAGNTDRKKMLEWIKNYDAQGLSNKLGWDDKGELAETPTVWTYKVENGKIVRNVEIK